MAEVTHSKRRWTIAVLAALVAALIAWDVWMVFLPPADDTFSAVLMSWATEHPVVPFFLGVLGGHLCWPQWVLRK